MNSTDSRAPGNSLPRKLGLFSAIAVLVGSTIGSGVFRVPAGIAQRVPEEELFFLIWVLGGLFTLCGTLTYAELSSALPRTGGVFVYLREGFGRLPAFLFGWAELTVIRASALGAIATVFAEYFLRLLGQQVVIDGRSAPAVHYVAAAAIFIVAVFNVAGVRIGALVQNLTTVAKYGALVVLVGAAFLISRATGAAPSSPETQLAPGNATSLSLFGLALISVLWAYDGWADVTFVSGEVKKPERNLPLSLIVGTVLVIAIYLLANLAYFNVLGLEGIAGSRLVAADMAYQLVGDAGVTLVSMAVMISTFGTLNGSMMTGPRIFFAMADDGLFFRKIASVHPRLQTPYVAITLAAVLAIGFVMARTFEQLAETFVIGIWPFYAGGVAAVYMLRRKHPDMIRSYKAPGYPVTPALFVVAALFVVGNAVWTDSANSLALLSGNTAPEGTGATLATFLIILLGIPAYLIWNRLAAPSGRS